MKKYENAIKMHRFEKHHKVGTKKHSYFAQQEKENTEWQGAKYTTVWFCMSAPMIACSATIKRY